MRITELLQETLVPIANLFHVKLDPLQNCYLTPSFFASCDGSHFLHRTKIDVEKCFPSLNALISKQDRGESSLRSRPLRIALKTKQNMTEKELNIHPLKKRRFESPFKRALMKNILSFAHPENVNCQQFKHLVNAKTPYM